LTGRTSSSVPLWKLAWFAIMIYGGLALIFTAFGVFLAPSSALVGGTRPDETIPTHFTELAAFGLALGLVSVAIYGRRGMPVALLSSVLTVILDIDHLPAYLGYSETIRPAHSLVFIIAALAVATITIKAMDIELVMASAFMGHMAVDTGLFAPLSPLSFTYYQLDPYRIEFAVAAVLCALAAGVALRMRVKGEEVGGTRDNA